LTAAGSEVEGGERSAAIINLIRSAYEKPEVVSRYASVGLWPSEEILVLDYFADDARVLDLGCGAGRTTVALAEIGLPAVGIDISELMIEVASVAAACVLRCRSSKVASVVQRMSGPSPASTKASPSNEESTSRHTSTA